MPRNATCSACGFDLKLCLTCIYYDESAHQQCLETEAEWVKDKEQANFCDYFSPCTSDEHMKKKNTNDIKNQLESLFADSNVKEEKPSSPLKDLENLFKKKTDDDTP